MIITDNLGIKTVTQGEGIEQHCNRMSEIFYFSVAQYNEPLVVFEPLKCLGQLKN